MPSRKYHAEHTYSQTACADYQLQEGGGHPPTLYNQDVSGGRYYTGLVIGLGFMKGDLGEGVRK